MNPRTDGPGAHPLSPQVVYFSSGDWSTFRAARPRIMAMVAACRLATGCALRLVTLDEPSRVRGWLGSGLVSELEITRVTRGTVPGIYATPTIALVGRHGEVTDLLVGTVDAATVATFVDRITSTSGRGSVSTEAAPNVRILRKASRDGVLSSSGELVVEVRERGTCRERGAERVCLSATGIHREATSLEMRAGGRTIVLDCTITSASTCRFAIRELGRLLRSDFVVAVL